MFQRSVFVVVVATSLAACAVPRGQLPAPPSYYDLINNGSSEQQEDLARRYQVQSDLTGVQVGEATRTRGRIDGPFPTEWQPVHPEVRQYLASDKQVDAALPSQWLFMPAVGAVVLGAGSLIFIPIALVAGGIGALAFGLGGQPKFSGPWNLVDTQQRQVLGVVTMLGGAAFLSLVCAAFSGPLLAAGGGSLWWINQKFVAAQALFNKNLKKRIAEASTANQPTQPVVAPVAPSSAAAAP